MNRWIRGGIAVLFGAALLIGAAGADSAAVGSSSGYEALQVETPSLLGKGTGNLSVDDGKITPTLAESTQQKLKGASALPSAYMYSLSELTEKYPVVRDQGDYETCWAFSAIGLAEFDLITDDGIKDSTVDLSEYQLAYFSYHNQVDAFGGTYGDTITVRGNYLRAGGILDYCSRTLLQWEGVTEESLTPYRNLSANKILDRSYAFDQDVAHLQNVYIINIHTNQSGVKQEILNHGSAGIGLYMSLTEYSTRATYDKTGEQVVTYYCSDSQKADEVNHALNIVGWDDDFPATAFADTPAGNGAWLVRNSWSDKSENDLYSYFWISYYDKSIEDAAWIFDFESADNYDYNYQYDGCVSVRGFNLLTNSRYQITKYANVFKTQGASNELLRAVSITISEDTNVPYTIRVYANLSSASKPQSGVLVAKETGTTTYAGTYTIPLSKAVSLPKGTYYSVVVEIGKSKAGLDTEYSFSYRGYDYTTTAYAGNNQSFIYYQNAWRDLAAFSEQYYDSGIGNVCIKAYTDKTGTSLAQTKSLKSSSVKKNSAKLTWAKTSGADGYVLYRSTSKNGTYTRVATTRKTSYTDTKLDANTTYYYRVRAYKKTDAANVYGKLSSVVKVTTKKK